MFSLAIFLLLTLSFTMVTSQTEQYFPVSGINGYEEYDKPNSKLSVVIYDKRAIFDPPGQYGKGPWELFTFGYGVKYGFDMNKFFEKGYGYVKALGRDFCRKNPHSCPSYYSPQPFTYRGTKEPYWGFRPRGGIIHPLREAIALNRGYHHY
ncbi:uncharacterized protein LOC143225933 [Tachypleus tridentatus]|uniref:uncharacterized protein LOC143225933 n=1 Tax=Tachypleus tridentatus TaxID=6853 RepID=UPI003FD2008A